MGKLNLDIKPKIVLLADKPIIYRDFKGEYSGKEFDNAWGDFGRLLHKMIF